VTGGDPVSNAGHEPPDQLFEYALIRVVPRIERGEAMNVGIILYSSGHRFLACRMHLDQARLLALDPQLDLVAVAASLAAMQAQCHPVGAAASARAAASAKAAAGAGAAAGARWAGAAADPELVATGPTALPPGQLFRWLTAIRSTIVQPGPVHTGLTADPAAELKRLYSALVR